MILADKTGVFFILKMSWYLDSSAHCVFMCVCVCRFALSSMDMEQRDYDSRTALHVAAAEGNMQPEVNLSILNDITVVPHTLCY